MGEYLKSNEQTMSSLEIAEATGRHHKHIMESIRKMEPAWEKVHGTKFRLMSREIEIGNGAKRTVPCYELTKLESLYIATKFKDEARAKLILRWEALETGKEKPAIEQKPMTAVQMFALQAQINLDNENRLAAIEKKLEDMEQEREENKKQLLALPTSTNQVPEMTVRKNIIALVNSYCTSTNTAQKDAWHKIYQDLYYRYGKSINNYKKIKNSESKLDVAERNGLLPYIMDIVSEMISQTAQSA